LRPLVIGCGNALRRDDGAGLCVARLVASRSRGVSVLECHGLTPELAEPIARAASVVFVDAQVGGAVTTLELVPIASAPFCHLLDGRALLDLAERVFGRRPPAWMVTVPAFDTEIGEGLSPGTGALLDRAVAAVLRLVDRAPAV
jgi:hydrogenase maturation protease